MDEIVQSRSVVEVSIRLDRETGQFGCGASGPWDIFTLQGMLTAASFEFFKRMEIAAAQARAQNVAGVTTGGILIPGHGAAR